jgi:hypothetical protein
MPENSIVLELQKDAVREEESISALLRKACFIAYKLNLPEFSEWIKQELNGYQDKVPNYRIIQGSPRGWNPYHGWIPIQFEDHKMGEELSKRSCSQSIIELEHLVSGGKIDELEMRYSYEIQNQLSMESVGYHTEVKMFFGRGRIIKIIGSVRQIILEWALKMEKDGILAENMSFTDKEKKNAVNLPQNVNNFHAPVYSPQIQQGNQIAVQNQSGLIDISAIGAFVSSLKSKIRDTKEIALDEEVLKELNAEVATIESQIQSPKPKETIIQEGLKPIKSMLENAVGGAVGHMLLECSKLII